MRLSRTLGFQLIKTAYATIKGFEVMWMIRRRHCILNPRVTGEARFINKLFDLASIFPQSARRTAQDRHHARSRAGAGSQCA